jgi:hypothetical protein
MRKLLPLMASVSAVIVLVLIVNANWYDYRWVAPGRNTTISEIQVLINDGWQPVPGSTSQYGVSFYYQRPHLQGLLEGPKTANGTPISCSGSAQFCAGGPPLVPERP